jgi:hypothetical protein
MGHLTREGTVRVTKPCHRIYAQPINRPTAACGIEPRLMPTPCRGDEDIEALVERVTDVWETPAVRRAA